MHHAMKTYGGVKAYLHAFLIQHQMEVSGQLHAPATLLSWKESPAPTETGGWMGSRDGLNMVARRNKSLPCP